MSAPCSHCTCGRRGFPRIRHGVTNIRHVATGICRDPLPYTKMAPMMQCAMSAIYSVLHVYCTYFCYSHSIVRNSLQFVPVCRSLLQYVLFALSLKKCRESMGSNLGHGFSSHPRHFRGSHGVTANFEQYRIVTWTSRWYFFSPRSGFSNCGVKRGLPVHWLPWAFTKGKVGKAPTAP